MRASSVPARSQPNVSPPVSSLSGAMSRTSSMILRAVSPSRWISYRGASFGRNTTDQGRSVAVCVRRGLDHAGVVGLAGDLEKDTLEAVSSATLRRRISSSQLEVGIADAPIEVDSNHSWFARHGRMIARDDVAQHDDAPAPSRRSACRRRTSSADDDAPAGEAAARARERAASGVSSATASVVEVTVMKRPPRPRATEPMEGAARPRTSGSLCGAESRCGISALRLRSCQGPTRSSAVAQLLRG